MQIGKIALHLLQSVWRPTIDSQLVLVLDHFDMAWYLTRYPDIAASGVDPLIHYMQHGWREGRWASPTFDTGWYLSNNPDVVASKLNPLFHYALHGYQEGRKTTVV